MPALANPKHELFAQGLFQGMTADAAYQAAGYAANRGNAARLKADESIMKRVEELQKTAQTRAILSLEAHMKELEALREFAKANNQSSAAVSAEVKRGELMGYYVERRESTNTNYNISDKPLSEDEWSDKYGVGTSGRPANRAH
jgi:phage terminase small subunit